MPESQQKDCRCLKNCPLSAERGFTLIEVAIVIIVIGLIVGGALVGRDLISSAEVRSQLTQIEKLNTASNTFREKYAGIAGDLSVIAANQFGFVTTNCTGVQGQRNGDEMIYGAQASPSIYSQDGGETALFWQDLYTAKLIDLRLALTRSCNSGIVNISGTGLTRYLVQAVIGNGNYILVYYRNGYNWYGINAVTSIDGSSNLMTTANIPVRQAYSIDKKMDDGLPTTGTVQAFYYQYNNQLQNAANAASDSASTCYNTGSSMYSIGYNNGSGTNCALSFRFH